MSARLWLILTVLRNAIAAGPGFVGNVTSISSPSLTTVAPWTCWPILSRIIPPAQGDCRKLADSIQILKPTGRPYMNGAPIYFGPYDVPGVDFRLPMKVTWKTCMVRLQNLTSSKHDIESFTPRFLSHAIHRMVSKCLISPPHVGGEGGIGPKRVVALVMSGLVQPLRKLDLGNHLVIEQRAVDGSLEHDILVQDLAAHTSASQKQ